MFRLFNNIPTTFPVQEIQAGQHLGQATTTTTDLFFKQKVVPSEKDWQLFYLQNQWLYWGKVQQDQVVEANFYQLDKTALEKDFVALDNTHNNHYLNVLQQYVIADLEQIDGAIYRLLDLKYTSLSITLLTSWEFVLQATLTHTPLRAKEMPEQQENVPYRVIVNPTDFSIIQARML